MTTAEKGNQVERLLFAYRRVEEVLYGTAYFLRVDASEAKGEIPLGAWESPFVVSKQLGTHEIVYGSVLHHMQEAARPIFRIGSLQKELEKSLPAEVRASMVGDRSANGVTFTSPTSDFPALFLYQNDEIIKDAALLSALPVRTLMEMFSGTGNRMVPIYDYEGNPTGGVSMQQLLSVLDHHRYCVVSGGFIHDIFSRQATQGLPNLFGTKVKVEELLTAMIGFIGGITVNDFAGMLLARLKSLTIDSQVKDIIFAHQNVYALTEVVRSRLVSETFLPFLNYLFSTFTAEELQQVTTNSAQTEVLLRRRFTAPRFGIGPDLSQQLITMTIAINDRREAFDFSQQEFVEKLAVTCGTEPLIPMDRLRHQIDGLAYLV